MARIYAGIGSRQTPAIVCRDMTRIATQLRHGGWLLRSGHADGADKAFEGGTDLKEIHLPWTGYNGAARSGPYHVPEPIGAVYELASRFHPKWDYLSSAVKRLMCRNATIILGADLDTPVGMVVCWTPGAALAGGTAHGIKIAQSRGIPVLNLADPEAAVLLEQRIGADLL